MRILATLLFLTTALPVLPQSPRPPAVPLITHDPYFSIWSFSDTLTGSPTRHWTGTAQPISSLIRIDGKPFRIMGDQPETVPPLPQTALAVEATHTTYTFSGAGVELTLAFFTPAFPQDMALLSRPVTYLTWTAHATDAATHAVSILLDVNPVIAVDSDKDAVTWSRAHTASLQVLSTGSRDQRILNRSGDNLRIDWGYFHLAVPQNELLPAMGALANAPGQLTAFASSGALATTDDLDQPTTPHDGAAHLAALLSFGAVGPQPVSRHVLVAYTDGFSIEYLDQRLRPFWQRDREKVSAMLDQAEQEYPALDAYGRQYDADLARDLTTAGGPDYARLALLSYRQAIAAHKLTADTDGTPLLFAKENFSNGDIGTVDVLYPTAPLWLFFNPALLEAQVVPVLRYASLPRWKFPFAPHDLGRWPLADGQEYGGGEQTEDDQMPVEESGDLLLLADALAHAQGDAHVAQKYWPIFTKWAEYLREKGLDPENQLSTDDFAGHLAHNANLSIKAIDALGAYSDLARQLGHSAQADDYRHAAEQMATQWQSMAIDHTGGDHYKLAFDKPGSWSQKYNLVWDNLLALHLFPPAVSQTETRFYLAHENKYGLPLDSRRDYTKLDWEVWTATLAGPGDGSGPTPRAGSASGKMAGQAGSRKGGAQSDFARQIAPLVLWTDETPARVPLTDWYDTKTGVQQSFQARSVVGGIFIKALADESLAKKWRAHPLPAADK